MPKYNTNFAKETNVIDRSDTNRRYLKNASKTFLHKDIVKHVSLNGIRAKVTQN